MTVAFGNEIRPEDADLETVRDGMLVASAEALGRRFGRPAGARGCRRARNEAVRGFRAMQRTARRRMWVNGHQIGQINALQRRQPFYGLNGDPGLVRPARCLADVSRTL